MRLFDAKKKQWFEFKEEGFKEPGYVAKENMYIEEIKNFLRAVNKGKDYPYSLEQDYQLLKLLEKVEQSAEKQTHILI